MGIEALPDATVRVIGATQVLNDPASLVKELIDNALDARSTNISIEIHSNTLDSIQVRDNGHGIPREDRLLVARPHCTSKIGGESDLKVIGGSSLGFRGEALASAAEMSGSLTISTRVEGEEVATSLKISQQGEVDGQTRASLPIGTTVKITDFIKSHPVRRQVALKNTDKTLAKIKQMLKSYAFARIHVRLSLRVLKTKNDKGNWTYAPKAGGNAEDAAFKIVGAACASQCIWSVIEDQGYTLQAFVPRMSGDVTKYSNVGTFMSVDGRPVSTTRGLAKQVQRIFREALKSADPRADGVKEPFFFLAIACPPGSYDANVEPAKDDVIFEDADVVIGLVRRMFNAAYPVAETIQTHTSSERNIQAPSQRPAPRLNDDDFVTSLEQAASGRLPEQSAGLWTPLPTNEAPPLPNHENIALLAGRPFRPNMYGCDEEDLDLIEERPPTRRTEADQEDLRQVRNDVNASNPWILAKMNTTVKQHLAARERHNKLTPGSRAPQTHPTPQASPGREWNGLPTPRPSSPLASRTLRSTLDNATAHSLRGPMYGLEDEPGMTPGSPGSIGINAAIHSPQSRRAPEYNYDPAARSEAEPAGTPLHMVPEAAHNRRQSPKKQATRAQPNPPFKPPGRDAPPREKVWFDHLESIDNMQSSKRPRRTDRNTGLVVQGELGDLVDEPRPLTPPRRDRDLRDFLTAREGSGDNTGADVVEGGQSPREGHARSVDDEENRNGHGSDELQPLSNGALGARGFVPASEIAALEKAGRLSPAMLRDTSRTTKRRRTSERRVLRKISGNAASHDDNAGEMQDANIDDRAISKRRRTTEDGSASKPRRSRSFRLPLERIPKAQGTQNFVLGLSRSMHEISSIAGKIDEERSLLAWNQPSAGAHDVFAMRFEGQEMKDMADKLHALLAEHVPGGETTQNSEELLQDALSTHAARTIETESPMQMKMESRV